MASVAAKVDEWEYSVRMCHSKRILLLSNPHNY